MTMNIREDAIKRLEYKYNTRLRLLQEWCEPQIAAHPENDQLRTWYEAKSDSILAEYDSERLRYNS